MMKAKARDHLRRDCQATKQLIDTIAVAAQYGGEEERVVANARDAIEKLISIIQYATLCNEKLNP